ncbi:hypothetical protein [Pseudolysinimonas yzui]|uniref:hypothetical protein n=1 Tax=Pseudolysinimonas yzui TaxID=2708254 RepID=UPI0017497F45|nr:hypothetical protein [Pseudolysinimonas yzui]
MLGTRRRSHIVIPIAGVILAMLAGCAAPDPSPSASSTSTPSVTPSPTAEATAEPLTIPDCETLLPLADAQALFSANTEFFGEFAAVQFGVDGVPEAATALAGASLWRFCGWGVPSSDGAFTLLVAEIAPDDRAALEAALTGAGFGAVTMGTVTGYDAEREGEVSTLADTLLFTGEVMIVCNGTSLDLTGAVTGSALDALRTANPTLGL